jgi:pimeloyl-ACP methyl ester carboxylesterase
VSIAASEVGSGYPLVVSPGWISHIELDWSIERSRRFYEALARNYRVVRYNRWGTGLSERNVSDYSLRAQVADLAAVIEAVGARRVPSSGPPREGR